MSEKYLINDSINFKVTVHGLPEPKQFIEAFIHLEVKELDETIDEDDKKDSDISTSE